MLAVLLLVLALALWPSAVLGTAAPASETTVAGITSEGGALAVDADAGDDDHHMMGDGWWGGGWWILMVALMVLFWGAVIGVVVWVVTQASRGGRGDGGRGDTSRALDIAQERYARGEISREEFEQIRRDLR